MAQKQRVQAREKALDNLIAAVEVPISEEVIEREVHNHLEGEGRLEDDTHRAEVTEESQKSFKSQMILDEVAKAEEIKPEDQELINYLVESAGQYGMQPNDFIQTISQNGQIGMFASELSRRKALDFLVDNAKVVDSKGKAVKFEKPEPEES
jgi:trigger factor